MGLSKGRILMTTPSSYLEFEGDFMKGGRRSRARGLNTSYYKDYEFLKMTRNLCIDRLSRPGNANKITGRGVAMATTRKLRKVRCYNCQEFGHIKRDRTISKQKRPTTSK